MTEPGRPLSLLSALVTLPGPEVWPALAEGLQSIDNPNLKTRDKAALSFFAASLMSDRERQAQSLKEIEGDADADSVAESYALREAIVGAKEILLLAVGDSERLLKELEQRASEQSEYDYGLEIPDLVAIVGRSEAEKWLRAVLPNSGKTFSVSRGTETARLAAEIALEPNRRPHRAAMGSGASSGRTRIVRSVGGEVWGQLRSMHRLTAMQLKRPS